MLRVPYTSKKNVLQYDKNFKKYHANGELQMSDKKNIILKIIQVKKFTKTNLQLIFFKNKKQTSTPFISRSQLAKPIQNNRKTHRQTGVYKSRDLRPRYSEPGKR